MFQLGKLQTMALAFSISILASWPGAAKKLTGADIPEGAIKIDDLMIVLFTAWPSSSNGNGIHLFVRASTDPHQRKRLRDTRW